MKQNSANTSRAMYALFTITIFVLLGVLIFSAYSFVQLSARLDSVESVVLGVQDQNERAADDLMQIQSDISDLNLAMSADNSSSRDDDSFVEEGDLVDSRDISKTSFSSSALPFTFEIPAGYDVVSDNDVLEIGDITIDVQQNEVKLVSESLQSKLKSSDVTAAQTHDVVVTYFEDSGIEDAKEDFYDDDLDFAEKIESSLIGSYVVDVYEGVSDIQGQRDYFVSIDDYTLVVSGRNDALIEEVVETLR